MAYQEQVEPRAEIDGNAPDRDASFGSIDSNIGRLFFAVLFTHISIL